MQEKKWDIYVYGDVNIDIVIPGVEALPPKGEEHDVATMKTLVGGGAALFTLGTGKLGLKAVFQGEIGNDFYGSMIQSEFAEKNIDTALLAVNQEIGTGISLSFTNEQDRCFLTYRGTNQCLNITKINLEKVRQARHVHVTGYSGSVNHEQYAEILPKIQELTDATVSFDLGWDSTGEWNHTIYQLFPHIDVLFMNETEAIHYSGKPTPEQAAEDFGRYCSHVVIKLGKSGSIAYRDGNFYGAKGYSVVSVDSTGAGDSFNAGYIYAFLRG
ncbi:MAG: carbohydrate kinase family protein, partial [Oscillospiraceae bacterium]